MLKARCTYKVLYVLLEVNVDMLLDRQRVSYQSWATCTALHDTLLSFRSSVMFCGWLTAILCQCTSEVWTTVALTDRLSTPGGLSSCRVSLLTLICYSCKVEKNCQKQCYYSTPVGFGVLRSVCPCVCLSLCPRAYLWNHWTNLHEILCADPLWPWLGPPLAALW